MDIVSDTELTHQISISSKRWSLCPCSTQSYSSNSASPHLVVSSSMVLQEQVCPLVLFLSSIYRESDIQVKPSWLEHWPRRAVLEIPKSHSLCVKVQTYCRNGSERLNVNYECCLMRQEPLNPVSSFSMKLMVSPNYS